MGRIWIKEVISQNISVAGEILIHNAHTEPQISSIHIFRHRETDFGKRNYCLAFNPGFFLISVLFCIATSLCKEKIGGSFNRNDGADKSCDIGTRNTVEVPFASFHSLTNLYLVSFLAPRKNTKDLVHLFFLKQNGNGISSAESSLHNPTPYFAW